MKTIEIRRQLSDRVAHTIALPHTIRALFGMERLDEPSGRTFRVPLEDGRAITLRFPLRLARAELLEPEIRELWGSQVYASPDVSSAIHEKNQRLVAAWVRESVLNLLIAGAVSSGLAAVAVVDRSLIPALIPGEMSNAPVSTQFAGGLTGLLREVDERAELPGDEELYLTRHRGVLGVPSIDSPARALEKVWSWIESRGLGAEALQHLPDRVVLDRLRELRAQRSTGRPPELGGEHVVLAHLFRKGGLPETGEQIRKYLGVSRRSYYNLLKRPMPSVPVGDETLVVALTRAGVSEADAFDTMKALAVRRS